MSALALGGHLLLPAAARRPDDRVICDAAIGVQGSRCFYHC
jgi:hypothetical protein